MRRDSRRGVFQYRVEQGKWRGSEGHPGAGIPAHRPQPDRRHARRARHHPRFECGDGIEAWSQEVGESVYIAIRDGRDVVSIDQVIGHQRVALMGFQPTAVPLFGERGPEVRSMAMVRMAIWEPARTGLLAFGSADPKGFTEDMGAELVAFLARVVERTAERWPVL